ncbi:MAG TPA: inorganic phosphate transporter [Candidatus Dormibacteraeota bacterium]
MPESVLLALTIVVALGFDFTNGFHDTANAVATSISTKAIRPAAAVALSAMLNLVGAIVAIELLHTKVANTIGGLVAPHGGPALGMIIAALFGAIAWNLITWRAGIPSSSSHALIGGLIGMGVVAYGPAAVHWGQVVPVVIALVTSPIAGLVLAYVAMLVLLNVFRKANPTTANRRFRRLQILSGAFVSFSHGANDGQKTMGVVTLALVTTHHIAAGPKGFPSPPVWVVIVAALAIGFGTYAGGWRIIRTLGSRVIRLDPADGFVAQTIAAAVIQGATQLSLPVSTTHVVSGSVMGAGASHRFGAVRWGVARNILAAWVVTIPAAALLAAAGAAVGLVI